MAEHHLREEARREASSLLNEFKAFLLKQNAVADAIRVLEMDPNDAFALRTRAEAYRGLGQAELAIRAASRSLQIEPGNAFALDTLILAGKGTKPA